MKCVDAATLVDWIATNGAKPRVTIVVRLQVRPPVARIHSLSEYARNSIAGPRVCVFAAHWRDPSGCRDASRRMDDAWAAFDSQSRRMNPDDGSDHWPRLVLCSHAFVHPMRRAILALANRVVSNDWRAQNAGSDAPLATIRMSPWNQYALQRVRVAPAQVRHVAHPMLSWTLTSAADWFD